MRRLDDQRRPTGTQVDDVGTDRGQVHYSLLLLTGLCAGIDAGVGVGSPSTIRGRPTLTILLQ
jgi:hypothetical protein